MTVPAVTAGQRYADTTRAFDSVAQAYNGPLGNNALVQRMRKMLWQALQQRAAPGARLLDLGCGAGLDAVHFAQQEYRVTAIDSSAGMVAQAAALVQRSGVGECIKLMQLDMQDLAALADESYDAIYSDLGALNCLPGLAGLARDCAHLLKAGGVLICSVIGRCCPWEFGYYLLHRDVQRALVRFQPGQVPVSLNGHTVWTHYYSPGEFYRYFAARFRRISCSAANLLMPPPYLISHYERHTAFYRVVERLDRGIARPPVVNQMGDHFLIIMERRG